MASKCNFPEHQHGDPDGITTSPTQDRLGTEQRFEPDVATQTAFSRRTKIDTVTCQSFPTFVLSSNDEWTWMQSGSIPRRVRAGWLLVVLTGSALIAAGAGPCHAQCVEFSDRASQLELDAFVKSPSSLLARLRNDKEKLKYQLSAYIVTNPSVLPSVQTLISESGSSDRLAIGAALRLGEARCNLTKPDIARKIRDFTQRIGDVSVQAGYSAAGEDNSGPRSQPRGRHPRPAGAGDLLEGEWKTDLADPFMPAPLPQ